METKYSFERFPKKEQIKNTPLIETSLYLLSLSKIQTKK